MKINTVLLASCIFLLAFCPLFLAPCFAQAPCGTAHLHTAFFTQKANYRAAHDALEQGILRHTLDAAQRQAASGTAPAPPPDPLVLPVVFHIVHQNGPENLTDAQVQTALSQLNAAFAHTGYFAQNGAGTDALIEFCLAQQTPQKQPTTGITRTVSALTDMTLETEDLALKNLSRWNPDQYVNIWIVRSITSQIVGPGVGGYAFMPAAHGQDYDGLVMRASGLAAGPAQIGDFAHEMGHYLGLFHTFEGGCPNANCLTNGDRVCDTPPDKAISVPCAATNSCSTDADDPSSNNPFQSDIPDFEQNFMDYSPKTCYSGFSAGQGLRMRLAVEGARKSLLESKACEEPCSVNIALSLAGQNPTCDKLGSVRPVSTGPGPFGFRWSDGSTDSTLQNLAPGTYSLTLTNSVGCSRTAEITLTRIAPTSMEVRADSVQCHGGSNGSIRVGPVQGGQTPFAYSIDNQNFKSDFIFEKLPTGLYTLTVRDANGCTFSASAEVHEPPLLSVVLTGDPLVVSGSSFSLMAEPSPISAALRHILWEPAALFPAPQSLQQTLSILQPTVFRVTVADWKACTATDTLHVRVDRTRFVFFPNVIAPEGGEQAENQRFTAYGSEAVQQLRWLRVFDRWGNLLFERTNFPPNDPALGWDGRFQGQTASPGSYPWAAEVEYADGQREHFWGDVSVLR